MARLLLISHEPEAAPAIVGRILQEAGHDIHTHVVLADASSPNVNFPDINTFDAVFAFGSFANAYDERHRPWVEAEINLIRRSLDDDVPYLGICFGGQLLAESVGGWIERAPQGSEEIGLVSIGSDADRLPIPAGPWFTWHEDRMVLPEDIEVLARTDNAVQLFRKNRAVGTQFHPEADVATVAGWIRIGPDHIPAYTSGDQLIQELTQAQPVTEANCRQLVDWFLREIAQVDA